VIWKEIVAFIMQFLKEQESAEVYQIFHKMKNEHYFSFSAVIPSFFLDSLVSSTIPGERHTEALVPNEQLASISSLVSPYYFDEF
jgi:hypothetical protein